MNVVPTTCVAAIVLLFTIFVMIIPRTSMCAQRNPTEIIKGAMAVLGPLANSYLAELRVTGGKDKVNVRVRMHNGDPALNGCGFYFGVSGGRGTSDGDHFPQYWPYVCDGNTYLMRMTTPGVEYEMRLRLNEGQEAKRAEFHADGWHDTFVSVLCVGFDERTFIADGGSPRAFCVNNDVLKACKLLTGKWTAINIDWDDMMMTRTARGTHKIVFRDVDTLVDSFEKFDRDEFDADTFSAVCNSIDLVQGVDSEQNYVCQADLGTGKRHSVFLTTDSDIFEYKHRRKNPYGCFALVT